MPKHNYITWCSIAYYIIRVESDSVQSDIVSASLDWGVSSYYNDAATRVLPNHMEINKHITIT